MSGGSNVFGRVILVSLVIFKRKEITLVHKWELQRTGDSGQRKNKYGNNDFEQVQMDSDVKVVGLC